MTQYIQTIRLGTVRRVELGQDENGIVCVALAKPGGQLTFETSIEFVKKLAIGDDLYIVKAEPGWIHEEKP